MPLEDFLQALLDWVKSDPNVRSASRIDGETAIGIECEDGSEYFITIEAA